MRRALAAATTLAVLVALPPAAALGVLPPEPPSRTAPGLSTVVFRVPVRYEATTLHVSAAGDPVGAAGLAPADGAPTDWTPLSADPTLDLPPAGETCWRGYCGLAHAVVRLVAPNHDGTTRVPLHLEADGTRISVPLPVTTTPRHPEAHPGPEAVRVETPHRRTLEAVELRSADASWTAEPVDEAFQVPTHRLPREIPLTPTLVLRNGTTVTGPPVQLPAQPGSPAGPQPGPDDAGNGTPADGTAPDGPGPPEPVPPNETHTTDGPGGPEPPRAPARVDDARLLPTAAGLAVAALAAATRPTL